MDAYPKDLEERVKTLEGQVRALAKMANLLAKRDNVALLVALKAMTDSDGAREQLDLLHSSESDIEQITALLEGEES